MMNWWNMWEHSTPEALEFTQVKRNNHHPIPWTDKGKFYMFLSQLPLHVTTEPAMPRGLRQLAGSVGSFWGLSVWWNRWLISPKWIKSYFTFRNSPESPLFCNQWYWITSCSYGPVLFNGSYLGAPTVLKIGGYNICIFHLHPNHRKCNVVVRVIIHLLWRCSKRYVGALGIGGWFQVDDCPFPMFWYFRTKKQFHPPVVPQPAWLLWGTSCFSLSLDDTVAVQNPDYIPPIRAHPQKVWASS